MEDWTQIISVPVITALVYGAMEIYKYAVGGKETLVRLIPIFAVVLGIILGIIAFYAIPDIMPADNIFTAILIGGASGLAATGTNQVFKQLKKGKDNDSAGSNDGDTGEESGSANDA